MRLWTEEKLKRLTDLYLVQNLSAKECAKAFDVSYWSIKHALSYIDNREGDEPDNPNDPTQEEIALMTAAIRRNWPINRLFFHSTGATNEVRTENIE